MASDTLSISKDLRAAGFNEQQANALAMHMAGIPANPASREDLALAVSQLESRIDQVESRLDVRIDQVESRLLLKLGAGMAAGFGLVLTAISIGVGVILNQLG
ncbi:MAG: hypothetical protein F4X25_01035 [Chloroflexi bacterium]|nr:hypothetical protein [Chloroflexota bacterium]